MIDAEKLLSKVLAGTMQSKPGKKKKKKKYKKSDDLVGGLLRGLTSGKGLITAIGLGVGAYEILKHKSANAATGAIGHGHQRSVPPPLHKPSPNNVTSPPPPPPTQQQSEQVFDAPSSHPPEMKRQVQTATRPEEQNLAILLIQVMVAAAHADGMLDSDEEKRILEQLQEQGLTQEEKLFLLNQLHSPKTIAELVDNVNEPAVAQALYSIAVTTIVVDTPTERQWLDQLATALSLSENVKQFIEEEL